jgi:hypothetical protein
MFRPLATTQYQSWIEVRYGWGEVAYFSRKELLGKVLHVYCRFNGDYFQTGFDSFCVNFGLKIIL